jgi:hypothetical protein
VEWGRGLDQSDSEQGQVAGSFKCVKGKGKAIPLQTHGDPEG